MKARAPNPRILALVALMAAVVLTLTYIHLWPTPDGGYGHPGDGGIYFAAFAFGPVVGAVAGGLGTALADVAGAAGQWAPFSLVIHGVQGWVAGMIARRIPGIWGLVLATVVGGIIVVVGYFPVGVLFSGQALAVPAIAWNALQVLVGGAIGISLYLLIRQAYPPISRFRD